MMDYMAARTIPLAERLAKFSRRTASGCLEWTGALVTGYGYIQMGSRTLGTRRVMKVHRLAWELAHGPIPPGLLVCHRCDNKRCFETAHLFLGSNADNMGDMANKGRGFRKLGPDAVREVRRLAGFGVTHREIGARLGVTHGAVFALLSGRTHRHVT